MYTIIVPFISSLYSNSGLIGCYASACSPKVLAIVLCDALTLNVCESEVRVATMDDDDDDKMVVMIMHYPTGPKNICDFKYEILLLYGYLRYIHKIGLTQLLA